MGFDLQGFRKAEFETRTDQVRVEALAEWFEEGDERVFTVRGLSGEELARVREATDKNRNVSDVVEALGSSQSRERVEAIRELIGVTESVPNELVRRLEQLTLGSVDPELDHEDAKLLAARYPIEFWELTGRIMELTGEGQQPVKKKDSRTTQESKPASPSVAETDDSCSR